MKTLKELVESLAKEEKIIDNERYVHKGKVLDVLQKVMLRSVVDEGDKSIQKWGEAIHQYAIDHGFWEEKDGMANPKIYVPVKLCLIHSEISEALEGHRNGIPHGDKGCVAEELADATIRILDLCHKMGIDLEAEMKKKHAVNLLRPYKHGGKEC